MVRRRDKEATQSEILEAASQLFSEKGYADTSLTDIATLAGVTKSLIHHHFGTKEELWTVVAEHLFESYRSLQTELIREQPDTLQTYADSVRIYFKFLQNDPRLRRMQSWMALEDVPRTTKHGQLMVEGIAKLQRAQQTGELRDDIPPAFMLMSFLFLAEHWFQSKEMMLPELLEAQQPNADEQFLESIITILLDGIRPRG
jgi:TetR/AcrR family transcriptional regulator